MKHSRLVCKMGSWFFGFNFELTYIFWLMVELVILDSLFAITVLIHSQSIIDIF